MEKSNSNNAGKKPRKLLDLDVREVSLVDRPAIRREFLVVKRDSCGEKMTEENGTLAELSEDMFVFEEHDVEKQESVDDGLEEQIEELLKAYGGEKSVGIDKKVVRMLLKTLESLRESAKTISSRKERKSVMEAVKALDALYTKYSKVAKAEEEEDEKGKDEEDEEEMKRKAKEKEEEEAKEKEKENSIKFSKSLDGSYDLSSVPKEMRPTVEAIWKQHEVAVQKATELEEVLKAERDERLRRDYVEKAQKDFNNLPGSHVEVGLLLKSLNDLDTTVASKVEGIFKSVNEQLGNSAILQEFGRDTADTETTAWGRIEKQAAEMMTSGEVSKAAAVSKVLEMNPKLYQDYLKEGGN